MKGSTSNTACWTSASTTSFNSENIYGGKGGERREGERGDSQVESAVSLVPRLSCMDREKRAWYALFAHSSHLKDAFSWLCSVGAVTKSD